MTAEEMRRAEILTGCWTACREQIGDMRFLLDAVRKVEEEQLRAACLWVATHQPRQGQSTLRAVMDSIDAPTRHAQRKSDSETDFWIIPTVAIDPVRFDSQMRILHRYKRRASSGAYRPEDLVPIVEALEADSPSLAARNAKTRERLDYFAKYRRFP